MQAYRLFAWKEPARLVDVPIPEPGPGEVLIKVAGNGICQSDLHLMHDWEAAPPHLDLQLPMTIGHEIGGWVAVCGPGVTGLETGQPCVVTLAGCGRCRYCAAGWNNYCPHLGKQPGMGLDGGLAEYVLAPAAGIVPLDTLEPWQAAPLTDAGLSAYHAVRRVLPLLAPAATAVVIGIGGLGHLAVMILQAVGAAEIIAVDRSPAALELAGELGADHLVPADADTEAAIRDLARDGGVEVVLDFVGSGDTVGLAARVIRPLGQIVVVGRGPGSFAFRDRALPYGAGLSTTFGGSKLELMDLVALAERGRLRPRISRYPLSRVAAAYERLRRGEVVGRAVIVPEGHDGAGTGGEGEPQ
jgi:propanol-preferring alcohol dehydrogenase